MTAGDQTLETPDSERSGEQFGSWCLGERQACLGLSSWQQGGRCSNVPRTWWTVYIFFLTYIPSKKCFIITTYSMDWNVLFLYNKPNTVHIGLHIQKIIFRCPKGYLCISTESNCTSNSSYHLLSFFIVPTTTMYLGDIVASSYNLGQVLLLVDRWGNWGSYS